MVTQEAKLLPSSGGPGRLCGWHVDVSGDTAIVAMQYSYLPSWLTLMVEPEASSRAATAAEGPSSPPSSVDGS